jgi:glycosyltransferase involved in cell wall biosynthesis
MVIRALTQLPHDVIAVIVGGPHFREPQVTEELHRLAEGLGVADRVRMPGWRSDVPSWLQAADVFVSASEGEPFGIVMVEALALGVPVVGTTGGGAEEIVRNGVDGLLIAPGEPAELAQAIRNVLDGQSVLNPVSLRRRADTFSADRTVQHLLAATCSSVPATQPTL